MERPDDERAHRVRRNNRVLLAVLVAFVLAVFANSFFHIGQEARPVETPATSRPQP